MGIAAVGNNLITYVLNEMHYSLSRSANIVTNFIGTVFLLALLGGYLSDSYLGSFWTMLIFGFVELSVSFKFSPLSISPKLSVTSHALDWNQNMCTCFSIYPMIPFHALTDSDLLLLIHACV